MNVFRSLSLRVLLALVLGLVGGLALSAAGAPGLPGVADTAQAIGALWLGALQMTVVPLIFAVLVTGIAQATDAAATGRLAARAVALFLGVVVLVTVLTLAGVPLILDLWPVNPAAAEALALGAAAGPPAPPAAAGGFAAWLGSLTPGNPVRAAAENAILPLVVFGVFFGFALTRLEAAPRGRVLDLFEALSQAMIVIVRWVLVAAPIGVFALALALALRGGAGSAGALLHYVLLASGACVATLLVSYPLAVLGGRQPLARFARAAAAAQAVAVGTQSSLASLPVMVERCREGLGISERTTGVVLPLAVSLFRITSTPANLTVALFIAHVSGVQLDMAAVLAAGLVAVAVSIGSVGLPGQVSFFASLAPICLAMGAPLTLLPLLLAVEVIPDIFRTIGNVTADMAAAAALDEPAPDAPAASSSADIPS